MGAESVASVSQSLGIGESLLYKWRAEFSERETQGSLQNPLELENETLRKQVR